MQKRKHVGELSPHAPIQGCVIKIADNLKIFYWFEYINEYGVKGASSLVGFQGVNPLAAGSN